MANKTDAAEFLSAIITHGVDEPSEAVERLGDEAVFGLITAAAMVAVNRKFGESVEPSQIQQYVTELKVRFADQADEVKPAVVEAVVRGMLGEGQLLEGLDRNDVVSAMFLLTYAIMSHEQLDKDAEKVYIDEVTAMAGVG